MPSETQHALFRKQGVPRGGFFLIKAYISAKKVSVQYITNENTVCGFKKGNNYKRNIVLKTLDIGNYHQWNKNPKQTRMGDIPTFQAVLVLLRRTPLLRRCRKGNHSGAHLFRELDTLHLACP